MLAVPFRLKFRPSGDPQMRSVLLALVRAAGVTLECKGASNWSSKFLVLATITMLPLVQAGCTPSPKMTSQDAAIATQTLNETTSTEAAIAKSRYRTYRWLSPEEMTVHQLGWDPGLD